MAVVVTTGEVGIKTSGGGIKMMAVVNGWWLCLNVWWSRWR